MMSRSFTTREKILILCLALVILATVYMKVVYIDAADTMREYPTQIEEAQQELAVEQQKNSMLEHMQRELKSVKANGGQVQQVPDYDNSKRIMEELNVILRSSQEYSLDFLPLEQEGNIIRRKIDLEYRCSNFAAAEQIIRSIDQMQYRCLITDLAIQGNDTVKTGDVSVRIEATFFELSDVVVVAPKEAEEAS